MRKKQGLGYYLLGSIQSVRQSAESVFFFSYCWLYERRSGDEGQVRSRWTAVMY